MLGSSVNLVGSTVVCHVFKVMTTKSDLGFTSNLVSLSFLEGQMTDVITPGLEDEVEHHSLMNKENKKKQIDESPWGLTL